MIPLRTDLSCAMEWRWHTILVVLMSLPCFIHGGNITIEAIEDEAREKIEFLVDLISFNLKPNGWSNIISAGRDFPDYFYVKIKNLPLTFTIIHPEANSINVGNVIPFYPNIVILHCLDFEEFENALRKAMASPHWHPHANTIIYYHSKGQEDIPKIFMAFWFYRICNGIVVQYDDDGENFIVFTYNPYVGENYKLSHQFGCWKTTKLGLAVRKFQKSFTCEKGCHNVTLHSKLRNLYLGTCIGYQSISIPYGDIATLKKTDLFEDKGKNLHGFVLQARGGSVEPFTVIKENSNGSYSLESRDGMIWNTAAERMNFTINLEASRSIIKEPFDFNVNIQQIFTFARRQADLIIFPVYQFDIIIVEIDMSIAYKDSGVCILSHRAGFETVLFDSKLLEENNELVIRFLFCFLLIWLLFLESGKLSFDQAGKDLVNTIRNVLSISLHKPPKRGTFRIYLCISIWCFFVINFATQAAIISFFSSYKRGKEVDTFEDIIEKGYVLEGMASPDMMLPDDEERFLKINSKIFSLPTLYGCVEKMLNDSRRFCLIDCSVGRYLETNALNEKGNQYLHVAKDRIHSYYLCIVFHKHSPLTKTFNRYLRMSFEAGLIKKWEQYRFSNIKEEVPIKALSFEDLIGIFKCYYFLLGISSTVFFTEVLVGLMKKIKLYLREKISKRKRIRAARKIIKEERKLGIIKPGALPANAR